MLVSDAVGAVLTGLGADTVFGVVGSGNFHVTNALTARGARFYAARHEGGAACMADGWARAAGRPGLLSVHQGPGLTNALTGITEAAKARTPLVVLAADVAGAAVRSNFRIDVASIAAAVGAVPERLHSPASAAADAARAYQIAQRERRTVVLSMPLDVQSASCDPPSVAALPALRPVAPAAEAASALAAALATARRPVFVAGRGARTPSAVASRGARTAGTDRDLRAAGADPADGDLRAAGADPADGDLRAAGADRADRDFRAAGADGTDRDHRPAGARDDLIRLADACGALLATSAAAKGLFRGSPWDLDVSGGFASPLAAELISGADLIVGWGCSLNMWTMRHGTLIGPGTTLVQVDDDAAAIGANRPVHLGVLGDVAETARAALGALEGAAVTGYRSEDLRARIGREVRWRDVPYTDEGDGDRIDPRTLSIALDDMLPAQRLVAIDSGNFMGYPSMYLSVPDADGFCFTQAYQSIGLGLASAIGAAIARPDRLPVAALGDGGALMGVSELETAVRLSLPMVIIVYDDEAYGAEVHHFGPDGYPLDTVRFPPADIAAIGRGFGCEAVTVHGPGDLGPLQAWLDGPRERPVVVHAKIASARGSWWLEEAFRGH